MDDEEIAAALFSGEYDHLTVAEFAARFPRPEMPEPLGEWTYLDVPVVAGIATLPDGRTVASSAAVVRVPILFGAHDSPDDRPIGRVTAMREDADGLRVEWERT